MKPTQPLDRHNLPCQQSISRRTDRIGLSSHQPPRPTPYAQHPKSRPTHRARVRLGVEATVARVVVLRLTGRAHDEAAHGGVGAVVGQRLDDTEARPAVGAVGEWIAVAAVGGIQHFGQTVGAGGDIGQHQRGLGTGFFAVTNLETDVAGRFQPLFVQRVDDGARRCLERQTFQKPLHALLRSFHLDEHPLAVVDHPAGERQLRGQSVDERAKADPLHRAVDFQPQPAGRVGRGSIVARGHQRFTTERAGPAATPPTHPVRPRCDRKPRTAARAD